MLTDGSEHFGPGPFVHPGDVVSPLAFDQPPEYQAQSIFASSRRSPIMGFVSGGDRRVTAVPRRVRLVGRLRRVNHVVAASCEGRCGSTRAVDRTHDRAAHVENCQILRVTGRRSQLIVLAPIWSPSRYWTASAT